MNASLDDLTPSPASQPHELRTSRRVAAEWWLDTAREAARTIPDAARPADVRITTTGGVTVSGSPRPSRRAPRTLLVSNDIVKTLAGTEEGAWRAAHAVASSRWPTRRDSVPTFSLLLGVVALSLGVTASAGSVPTVTGGIAAAACMILAVAIAVASRRRAVTAVQTSDRWATQIAGIAAARAALGGSETDRLYKTALHQWRYTRDAMQPHNRLARLEESGAGSAEDRRGAP